MDLALDNQQRLMCHKSNQPTNQPFITGIMRDTSKNICSDNILSFPKEIKLYQNLTVNLIFTLRTYPSKRPLQIYPLKRPQIHLAANNRRQLTIKIKKDLWRKHKINLTVPHQINSWYEITQDGLHVVKLNQTEPN